MKKKRKKRSGNITIFLLILIMGYFLYNFALTSMQIARQENIKNDLQAQIDEQRDKSDELDNQLKQVGSNKYIESLARKYFGLVYPNEKVIIEKNEQDSK